MAVYAATLSLRTNKVQFLCLTHPRHYAENGLRLLEEGDGVEGSSGFPGSVCLHPLHSPPLSLHSLLSGPPLLPAAGSKARLCGAPGNRHGISPNLLLSLLQQGWMLVSPRLLSAQPPVFSRFVFLFNLTSKFPVVLSRYPGRGSCRL